MKRAIKKKSTIYEYLAASEILKYGTPAEISAMRVRYWNDHKSKWQKQKRTETKQFTVSFTKKEFKILNDAAAKHNRSCTRYIQESSLAYSSQQFVIPDILTLNYIRELLTLTYNNLKALFDEDKISAATEKQLAQKVCDMERAIMRELKHPKHLENSISEAVENDPGYKINLLRVLKDNPSDS